MILFVNTSDFIVIFKSEISLLFEVILIISRLSFVFVVIFFIIWIFLINVESLDIIKVEVGVLWIIVKFLKILSFEFIIIPFEFSELIVRFEITTTAWLSIINVALFNIASIPLICKFLLFIVKFLLLKVPTKFNLVKFVIFDLTLPVSSKKLVYVVSVTLNSIPFGVLFSNIFFSRSTLTTSSHHNALEVIWLLQIILFSDVTSSTISSLPFIILFLIVTLALFTLILPIVLFIIVELEALMFKISTILKLFPLSWEVKFICVYVIVLLLYYFLNILIQLYY